jgi:ribosomal protein S2
MASSFGAEGGRRFSIPVSPYEQTSNVLATIPYAAAAQAVAPRTQDTKVVSKAGKRQLESLLNQWLNEKNIQLPSKKRCVEEKEDEDEEPLSDKERVWMHSLKSRLFDELHGIKSIEGLCSRALVIRYFTKRTQFH